MKEVMLAGHRERWNKVSVVLPKAGIREVFYVSSPHMVGIDE